MGARHGVIRLVLFTAAAGKRVFKLAKENILE